MHIGFENYTTAIATITAVWATPRYILLPAETGASSTAVTGLNRNSHLIDKHGVG